MTARMRRQRIDSARATRRLCRLKKRAIGTGLISDFRRLSIFSTIPRSLFARRQQICRRAFETRFLAARRNAEDCCPASHADNQLAPIQILFRHVLTNWYYFASWWQAKFARTSPR